VKILNEQEVQRQISGHRDRSESVKAEQRAKEEC
jgi:hypothetical protein